MHDLFHPVETILAFGDETRQILDEEFDPDVALDRFDRCQSSGVGAQCSFRTPVDLDQPHQIAHITIQRADVGIDESYGIIDFMGDTGGDLADRGQLF